MYRYTILTSSYLHNLTLSTGITRKAPPPVDSVTMAMNLGLTAQKLLSWAFFVIEMHS